MDDARALAGRRWHIGSMNDMLFIIDQPPRPSTDDPVHEHRDGISPSLAIPLHDLTMERAQAIVDAHNAAIDRLAAPEGVGLTRYGLVLEDGVPRMAPRDHGRWVRYDDAAAAIAAKEAERKEAERGSALLRQLNNAAIAEWRSVEAERDALKAALEKIKDFPLEFRSKSTSWGVGYAAHAMQDIARAAISTAQGGE